MKTRKKMSDEEKVEEEISLAIEEIAKEVSKEKKFYKVDEIREFYRGRCKKLNPKRNKAFIYYLIPKNYRQEMKFAGEEADKKKLLIHMGLMAAAGIGVSYLFKLKIIYAVLLIITGLCFVPGHIALRMQKKFEAKRLNDLYIYMEQVLYAFKENPNILEALKGTKEMFDTDTMIGQAVGEAIYHLENSISEKASEEALEIIEEYYRNDRLSTVHKLMLKIEAIGGEHEKSINILLEELNHWKERMDEHTASAENQLRNTTIACAITMGLCSVSVFMLKGDMSVTDYPLFQVSTLISAFIFLCIQYKAKSKTNIRWIETEDKYLEEEIISRYEKAVTYDEKKELKKSIRYAGISAGITVAVSLVIGLIKKEIPMLPMISGMGITILMINQHKVSYALNLKILKKEITKGFPKWLMELALRMQSENVQISIMDSYDNAPAVLKPALSKLMDDIVKNPESVVPYTTFLKEFNMPEVSSAMKMLYAVFAGKGSDADSQITELITRNNTMLNQAEKIKNEDALGGFYMLFLAPTLVGAVKIMSDMVLTMLTIMGNAF